MDIMTGDGESSRLTSLKTTIKTKKLATITKLSTK